ncbi:tRNA 2-thiouridine(34) synthase MnmA [Candidatus Lucifugimonas marina]|uniref:tRNA-specific 2-thiouridylase MnmA n=1 Tax=Candidatus Lucifugimonas marina TaxID=3038979 RepID=A0AAJ5ZHK0_9CHLR|nr:tRNA 2-thiouridine(34) synthase MnmA [SAR202 cluster bacterium JH702]MDG0868936.1 tRNA 2-thiouridine(34) synthase MnmA [SAR202 cluster bacterium JH639]WFG35563.1 tRNA 2-thiouridine(34) synthase MnmA [SAR202 cluster bacterium JH545]WFG39510.1 tRNA 2-thiouridine(34) synthase MnmA [SAR202 cluster bacterium JH1073]
MAEVQNKKKRAVVAMSGGVDSSVAAALLARDGYEVVGVTMRLFNAPNEQVARLNKSCCSLEDVEDARDVCRKIGAKHYFLNFEEEFQKHVVDYFVSEYERGRTPHPCLACNDRLKFEFLIRRAELMDADVVATGHFARIHEHEGEYSLLAGVDPLKDQSYVLYTLTQDQLSKLSLPIGDYSKDQIREVARELGLSIADKPDSQDICFIPDGDYNRFIEPRLKRKAPGQIVDIEGNILGEHEGIHGFTIGQRKRIPIVNSTPRPMYVTDINADSGQVTVGPAENLMKTRLYASGVNWIAGTAPVEPFEAEARIRYNGKNSPATVRALSNGAEIEFSQPVRAITPGQAVVFYKDDVVLGGGLIETSLPEASSTASGETSGTAETSAITV